MNGVTTPFDKPVLSEPLPLRQAQGERRVEGLRANGDKLTRVCPQTAFIVMPDLIRHPDVVPTKVGNHLKDWVPVFTGNPGFRLSPE